MQLPITAALSAAVLAGLSSAQAQLVFFTDFEAGVPPEFSGAGAATPTEGYAGFGFGSVFLHNSTAGNPAAATTLSLAGLPAHDFVSVSFDLAILDSWDGETSAGGTVPPDIMNVWADGASVFSETFDNFAAGDQSYPDGLAIALRVLSLAQNPGWPDSAYKVSIAFPHTAGTLALDWFASGGGWQAGLDESWAIDNLHVTLRSVAVPESGTVIGGAGVLALAAAGAIARRRRGM